MSNPPVLPVATVEDVKATLKGLTPGVYLSSVLHARYSEILATQGREPASPQAFGLMLRDWGLIKRQRQGKRAWLVQ